MERKNTVFLASRKSLLALQQSTIVKEKLEIIIEESDEGRSSFKNVSIEIKKFHTKADSSLSPLSVPVNQPLMGGGVADVEAALINMPSSLLKASDAPQGVFVKELEVAMLQGKADFAVHSLKDMPFRQPKGLAIVAYLKREDVHDIAIFNEDVTLQTLPHGAVVGTSSLRRILLLKKKFPHLRFQGIRGNVQMRLKKLKNGKFSAIVLAAAGLKRLEINPGYCEIISSKTLPPAPGQAIIAVQTRTASRKLKKILAKLNCENSMLCALAERRAMQVLQTGCTLPFAAHATLSAGVMRLHLVMARLETHRIKRCTVFSEVASSAQANALGRLGAVAMKKKLRR